MPESYSGGAGGGGTGVVKVIVIIVKMLVVTFPYTSAVGGPSVYVLLSLINKGTVLGL